jgi:hypothetical protein
MPEAVNLKEGEKRKEKKERKKKTSAPVIGSFMPEAAILSCSRRAVRAPACACGSV